MSSEIALEPNTEQPTVPVQPIVLTSPEKLVENSNNNKTNKGFLSTFAILFAGWLLGNLILLSILGFGTLTLASSTGLVKVPFLTAYFFGEGGAQPTQVDTHSLSNAQEKIKKIQSVSEGNTINSFVFYEDEINALLANKAQEHPNFPITWQSLSLLEGGFVFKGIISETNAPVIIKGGINTQGLTGEMQITEAKYGLVTIPSFIASNIVESQLSNIGLSLTGNQIPARAVEILDGLIKLSDVTKPQ